MIRITVAHRAIFLTALLAGLGVTQSFAAFSSKAAGTSGAAFLKLGAGARPSAMGDAFTGLADDVNTVQWNPAGLATIQGKNEFVAMRAQLFQDMEYNYFAFAHPMKRFGTVAITLNNLNITDIQQRTSDSDNPDSTFAANDTAYTLAWGMKWDEQSASGIHMGGALKYIRQTLAGETANAVAADLGALHSFETMPLSVGMSVQNLGTQAKFKNEGDALPLTIRMGASYRLFEQWGGMKTDEHEKNGLVVALDENFPRDNDPSTRLGVEFARRWSEDLRSAARAGYRTDRARQIEGNMVGISAGAGVSYKFLTFDFAWQPFGELGTTYRYSVKLRF